MAPPARRPPTRPELQRALAVNAATKPLNVGVGAGVAVAGIALGAVWLIALAVVVYAVLAVLTFFDGDEAERVGKRGKGKLDRSAAPALQTAALARPIRQRVTAAREEQRAIEATVAEADLDWTDVRSEVRGLVGALEATARRAQRLWRYLETQDADGLRRRSAESRGQARIALEQQARALDALHGRLDQALDEMDAVLAALGTVHASLVGTVVDRDGASDTELAGTVRELRERVDAVTDGLATAYPAT